MNGEVLRLAVVIAGFLSGAVFVISMSVRFFIELYGDVDLKKLKAKSIKKEQKKKRVSAGGRNVGYHSRARLGRNGRTYRIAGGRHIINDSDACDRAIIR